MPLCTKMMFIYRNYCIHYFRSSCFSTILCYSNFCGQNWSITIVQPILLHIQVCLYHQTQAFALWLLAINFWRKSKCIFAFVPHFHRSAILRQNLQESMSSQSSECLTETFSLLKKNINKRNSAQWWNLIRAWRNLYWRDTEMKDQ